MQVTTMKYQFVISLSIVAAFAMVHAQDVGVLLTDSRLVQKEINCILQQGPCDAIGRQIKALLPEALNNNCRRCNAQQARNARKLIEFMRSKFPNEWRMIMMIYTGNNPNNLG